ncbi:MAG: hypothetical protein AB1578_07035 [Thermodesulfobacteriota bacterium]
MALVFDFDNALIEVTEPQTAVAVQDLIHAIRDAEESDAGIVWPQIARASGKESLGGDVSVGITVELLGDWQLHFWEGNYIAKVAGGNLVGGPAGDPIAYSAGVQVLLIQSAASTVVAVGSGVTEGDKTEIVARVWEHASAVSLAARVLALWREFWAKKTLHKDSDTQYTEVLHDEGGTPIRTRTLTRSGDTETRQ